MIDNWFTNKCMTLVGANGRALAGEALELAELALQEAKAANHKVWTDRNGNFYHKERSLFASARPVIDQNGNQVRICGRLVKFKAKFCSKCGGSAPGSWWRCGGCGKMIGSESHTCPHCGRAQNLIVRLDLTNGCWRKDEDVFAERFELHDIAPLIPVGLNVQESQKAILLEGGAVADVLDAGLYPLPDLSKKENGEISVIMVDNAEFVIPVKVEQILTKDDIESDLHTVIVLRFSPGKAEEFMRNLMGSSLYLKDDALTASLGYDEIAHCILSEVDGAAREFCNNTTVADLFRDASTRIGLEDYIANRLKRNLDAMGMNFVRLKEVEFESEVFTRLRNMSGQIEIKRKEIEFMQRADELANDATRREAMSEHEMEEFMKQLAQEKTIKDDLRAQEIERMRVLWQRQKDKDIISHEHDLNDLEQVRQHDHDRIDAEFKHEMLDLDHSKAIERRINEQKGNLEYEKIESQIQEIKIDVERKKVAAEQDAAAGWLKLKQEKKAFDQKLKLEMLKAADGANLQAMLMTEEDPDKRRDLLAMFELQQQTKMTPELLLAAAAARGNAAAAEALTHMDQSKLDALERFKNENKAIYEQMLQMSERMFNQALDKMAQTRDNSQNNNLTAQIIK